MGLLALTIERGRKRRGNVESSPLVYITSYKLEPRRHGGALSERDPFAFICEDVASREGVDVR